MSPHRSSLLLVWMLLFVESAACRPPHVDCHGDPLPRRAVARLGTVRFRHGGKIVCVVYSPDGRMVASAGLDDAVRLWEAATGKELHCLKGHDDLAITSLAFAPDGKTLVSGCWSGVARVWDVATGKKRRQLGKNTGHPCWVTFAPDGRHLATVSEATLRLWSALTWREEQRLVGDVSATHALAFFPGGKQLAWGGRERPVRVWNLTTRKPEHPFPSQPISITAVAVSPDRKCIASAGGAGTVVVWDVATGRERWRIAMPRTQDVKAIGTVKFSPDGKLLAAADEQGMVYLWDVADGKERRRIGEGELDSGSLDFSPDGKTLVSAGGRAICFWDVATGKEVHDFAGWHAAPDAVTFSPAGKHVAFTEYRTVHYYHLDPIREVRRFRSGRKYSKRIACSPDGKTLVVQNRRGITFWEVTTGKRTADWESREATVKVLQPAPGSRSFLAWLWRPSMLLYLGDARTGGRLQEFEIDHTPMEATFSPDGQTLAVADGFHIVHLYHLGQAKETGRFDDPRQVSQPLTFAPGGRCLALASDKGDLYLWEAATGRERHHLTPHKGMAFQFLFAPGGQTLATWTEGNSIYLWDVETGKQLAMLSGHRGQVNNAAFSPDGKRLASVSEDTTLLLWDVHDLVHRKSPYRTRLGDEALDRLWFDLKEPDAPAAFRAMYALRATPAQAVALARKRLPFKHPLPHAQLQRLLTDLDSDVFRVRQKAMRDLTRHIEQTAPALYNVLASRPPLEVRRRVEELLRNLHYGPWGPEALRTLRMLEVLEGIGTPEAAAVLARMAKGAPEARLAFEAQASLQRVAARQAALGHPPRR